MAEIGKETCDILRDHMFSQIWESNVSQTPIFDG